MPSSGPKAFIFSALLTGAALAALGAAPQAQSAGHPKRDATLNRHVFGSVRVIVRTQPGQSDAVANTLTQRGRSVYRKHAVLSAVTASVTNADPALLDADPRVRTI